MTLPPAETPPTESPAPEAPVQPTSRTRRVLRALFSPETRTGKIMRPLLRWLGTIIGLFALGLVSAYLLLYLPTTRQKDAALWQFNQSQNMVKTLEADVKACTAERDALQKKLTQAATDLSKAQAKNDLLLVLVSINNARVALVNKDGPGAKTALDQAQVDLPRALPVLEKLDKTIADVLKSRLELASKELVIDPQAAQSDLDKLQADLLNLFATLFK